jgi:hypothetical protein
VIKVDVNIDDGLSRVLKGMETELRKYPDEAEAKFISLTPVKSGNARRNTNLNNQQIIEAKYPYAERLDTGWSKQAPQGMTKPFEAWINAKVRKIFGK